MGHVHDWGPAVARAAEEDVRLVALPSWGTTWTGFEYWDATTTRAESGSRYEVRVLVGRPGVLVGCTCKAGEFAVPCKHAATVLEELDFLPPTRRERYDVLGVTT